MSLSEVRANHFILRDPSIVHFSVDIETLAISSDAAITEIGGVVIGQPPERECSFFSPCVDLYGAVDPATVKWRLDKRQDWMIRSTDTYCGTFGLQRVLEEFFKWIRNLSTDRGMRCKLWCKGTDFDKIILTRAAQERCKGLTIPWRYNDFHDMRTVLQLFPGFKIPEDQIRHTAYDDAILQANQIMQAADHLEELCNARIFLATAKIG